MRQITAMSQPDKPAANSKVGYEASLYKAQEIQTAIAQLTTGDFHSRWDSTKQCAKQFVEWGDAAVSPLIRQLQIETDPANQGFIVRVLSQFDRPEVVKAIAQLLVTTAEEDVQKEATKALTTLGSSAIDTLSALLNSADLTQKILAARALAHIRRTPVIEPLLSVANHPDTTLRAIALEALGSFHDPRIAPVLIAATADEPAISQEAIRSLGRRRDLLEQPHASSAEPRVALDLIGPLSDSLKSPHPEVAKESAIALGRLGTPDAIRALSNLLNQPSPTPVKTAAVRALGWIGTPSAVAALAEAFSSTAPIIMPTVQQEIARSLGQTHPPALKSIAAKPLIDWLKSLQAQPNPAAHPSAATLTDPFITSLKQTVILSLSRLGITDAVEILAALLDDDDASVRIHALSAIEQLDPDNRHQLNHR